MCDVSGRGKKESNVCLLWIVYHSVKQKTNRHTSRHAYYVVGMYQCFQRHVTKLFFNQMKNGNTFTQRIIAKHPQVLPFFI